MFVSRQTVWWLGVEKMEGIIKNWWEEGTKEKTGLGRVVGFPLFEGREWTNPPLFF